MEVKLNDVQVAKTFKVAGVEFIKFVQEGEKVLAVTRDIQFKSIFGKNNNLTTSDVLKKLQTEMLPKIEAAVGVNYLGFHIYMTPNGCCIRKLKNQNKRNAQKKYLRMAKLVAEGKLSIEKFNTSYNAWKNHISHGNCYSLGLAMDRKIDEILGSDNNAE